MVANNVLATARGYVAGGLSVIPVRADGSKAPRLQGWRTYSQRRPTDAELAAWFGSEQAVGIGIPPGPASGNLAVLDIETASAWDRWSAAVPEDTAAYLKRCPIVRTPGGGAHVWVRLPEPVPGTVLARDRDKGTLIEVRGEGHQVLAPGCPASCHPTGREYLFEQRGFLDGGNAGPVPLDVWFRWIEAAAGLSEYNPPVPVAPAARASGEPYSDSPGADFSLRGSWEESGLFAAGWQWARVLDGDRGFVRRPGKSEGISGTVGMVKSALAGRPLFYPFTTNAGPFEAGRGYDRFGVFARLKCRGDIKAAARALGAMGYGAQPKPRPAASSSAPSGASGVVNLEPQAVAVRKPPAPRFTFIDAGEFLTADYRQRFLIPHVLVADQPGVVAGPSKAMKTSITVDMAVSLASASPFLGKFPIPHPARVAVVSGESGKATLQETARRVMAARGIDPAALANRLKWCFELPQFPDLDSMGEFAESLLKLNIAVAIIDPVYLCLGGGIDHANLFEMGAAFRVVAEVLLKAGVTPVLVHHANRQLRVGDPMEIQHLAYSGLEQFARQFIMMNRMTAYRGDGVHELWLSAGGSAGHGGLWSVRIEEGTVNESFGGRVWSVTVQNPGEAHADRVTQREASKCEAERAKLREAEATILHAIDATATPSTRRRLRDVTGFRQDKVADLLAGLVEAGVIEEVEYDHARDGRGSIRTKGFQRATGTSGDTTCSQPSLPLEPGKR